jgi:molybdenum cofactor cytidylyltransferase
VLRAIILAAGDSTRMGTPKALLPDGGGRVFVTRLLHTFSSAGVFDVTVVTGAIHDRIVRAVADDAVGGLTVRFARNPNPERGQLSSLLAGLAAADTPGVTAVLMTLVDVPFVAPETIRGVADGFKRTGAPIVRPAREGEHGHPVLFARSLFDELRRADAAQGAKTVVRAHATEILNIEVDDEGALIDLDTREEYERMLRS